MEKLRSENCSLYDGKFIWQVGEFTIYATMQIGIDLFQKINHLMNTPLKVIAT